MSILSLCLPSIIPYRTSPHADSFCVLLQLYTNKDYDCDGCYSACWGQKNRCRVIWSVLVCCVTATSPTSHLVITVLCNSISCLPSGRIKCQQRHKKLKRRQSAALPLWETSVRLAMYESISASSPSSYDANFVSVCCSTACWLHHLSGTKNRQPVTQQIEGYGPCEHVLWQKCIFPFSYENIDISWACIHFWIIGTI